MKEKLQVTLSFEGPLRRCKGKRRLDFNARSQSSSVTSYVRGSKLLHVLLMVV